MPLGLGFGELVLIFAVLLLLFGAKRLPELASGMGRGIRDFKRSLNGLDESSIQGSIAQPAPQAEAAPAKAAPAEAEPQQQRAAQ
ncbi:MAG TPA: twin-arginine translocase TatA/TatE family subunit [Longimicrobiaceae bacterium]|nr:twin-arginine translocase TatA/TatE family subunit [Longimicrobiaceae bacterium]